MEERTKQTEWQEKRSAEEKAAVMEEMDVFSSEDAAKSEEV